MRRDVAADRRRAPVTSSSLAGRLAFLLLVGSGLVLVGKGIYIHVKAAAAQVLLDRGFERLLAQGGDPRPWPWADFNTEARIVAPRLGRSAIVLSEASGEALAFGPARVGGTPEAGQPGTAVIAAHRDTHFRWLADLRPGDALTVTDRAGVAHRFTVRNARIARNDESGIDPERAGTWLDLATCWPFDSNSRGPLRYIVETELTPAPPVLAQSLSSTALAGGSSRLHRDLMAASAASGS
ncbi:sortase A [Hoeflea marina]|uniref:Sortase A n=1 Tax=Hoeflea marina TaxID=274592 RepID=A0A317PJ56_9HYPH|nr:class GN sortase [Hoeflea marina]PWV97637.1 sortase A [Hoeflea marina]